jgi:hypothetical protein
MITELQFESRSPFLPAFRIPVNKSHFTEGGYKGIDALRELVLSKEQEILESTEPYPKTDLTDWLTNRLYQYTLFDYSNEFPILISLKEHIKKSYLEYCSGMNIQSSKVYITCWANVLRKNGRKITPHHHADNHIHAPWEYSYVSGHISIAAEGTSTYYQNPLISNQSFPIMNIPGELYLFPSWVIHWTDENESDRERVSIAFDIITEEVYNMFPESNNRFVEL